MDFFLASSVFSPQYGKTLYDNYQRAVARAGLASRWTNLGPASAAPPSTGTVQGNPDKLRAQVQTYPTHLIKTELCWLKISSHTCMFLYE